jgi:hypothetical protein
MKSEDAQLQEIDRLLTKYDRKFAAAFREGIRKIEDQVTIKQIAEQLEARNVSAVMALFSDALVAAGFVQMARTLTDAILSGGDYAASIASANRIEFGFQITESNTARFMAEYEARLIRQITAEMRSTISQIIYREAGAGTNPITTARKIKAGLGLTANQEKAVENYRRYLMEADRRALENRLRDARFDPTVARSIKEGKSLSPAQIDKMVAAYRRRYIARRAETIARTESITMLNAGQDAYWRQMIDAGLVREGEIKRKWKVTHDSRLRHSHAAIPQMNPDGRGLNEPFRSPLGMIRYPGDPAAPPANRINCRCALFQRIERD